MATSNLKSLTLYRNGSKAGNIPRPMEMLQTKISGLAVDTEYSFHLVLRTTGGTFSSPTLTARTHKMTELSGITVTPGILPPQLRESLERAVDRIGAKIVDGVRIDTTHFVCTEGRGPDWERAGEMNIPVVRPEWVDGCEREGRIVGVRGYYLNANPKDRQVGVNPAFVGNTAAGTQSRQGSTVQSNTPGAASQTSLPSRSVPNSGRRPTSPERDGYVTGPGNGPGPEVPPTPPPKDESRRMDHDSEEDEADEEDDSGTETGEPDSVPRKSSDDEMTLAASEKESKKATVEDGEAGAEDMDEVPL